MQKEFYELITKAFQSFVGQAAGQVLSCFLVILIGRCLGADIYGEYLYVYTFLSFFIILTKMGMENAIVYYISRDDIKHDVKRKIIQFALTVAVVNGIVIVSAGYLTRNWIAKNLLNNINYSRVLLILMPIIILESFADLLFNVLKGKKKIFEMTIAQSIIGMSTRIILLLIMYYLLQIKSYFCIIVPQYVGCVLAILYCIYQINKSENLCSNILIYLEYSKCVEIFKYSFPLVLMNAVVLVNHNADKYMIGYWMDSASVAIYTVAIYIGNFSSFALMAVNSIFAPMISELYYSGKIAELDILYKKSTRWVMIINLAIFSMVINFPAEVMQLAGNEFGTGEIVLIIIMFGQIVNSGVGGVGYLNSMTGHTKINLLTSVVAVILNLVLNFLLIRRYGMAGAAIASAVSVIVTNILNLWYVYKNIGVFPYTKRYIGLGIAFLLSTILVHEFAVLLADFHYFIKLLSGGLLFVVLYVIFTYLWGLDPEEKEMLRKIRGGKR